MLVIGNKKFRNLPEQVGFNTEQIEEIQKQLDGMVVEDHLVVLASSSGTLTEEDLNVLDAPLAFVSYNEKLYIKTLETLSQIVFKSCELVADEIGGAYYDLGQSTVIITISTKTYAVSTNQILNVYSKDQIDALILSKTYPVGAIYVSADSTSPASLFGGTWSDLGTHYIPKGNVPVLPVDGAYFTALAQGNAYRWINPANGVVLSDVVLGVSNTGFTRAAANSVGAWIASAIIDNLYSRNTNTTYNTAVYVWQRIA